MERGSEKERGKERARESEGEESEEERESEDIPCRSELESKCGRKRQRPQLYVQVMGVTAPPYG
jgi:hypothetical protein